MNLAYDSRNRLTNGTVKGVIGSYGYDAEGVLQMATFARGTLPYGVRTFLSSAPSRSQNDERPLQPTPA
jgi:hypothetical protein